MADNNIDTSPSNVATNALQSIPFGSVIGGPLKACIDAQTQAAKCTYEFIRDVGLTTDKDGKTQALMVSFSFCKGGRSTKINVPLLTIVPIPYIAVKDININFKANISAASTVSTTTTDSFQYNVDTKTKAHYGTFFAGASLEVKAGVSSKKDSTATRDSKYSVEYTMDINVNAGQEDMPAGMAKVLEMLNESIGAVDERGELNVVDTFLQLNGGEKVYTFASYLNPDGYYAPEDIKILDQKGNEANEKDATVEVAEPGVSITFTKAGQYTVSAGDRKVKVVVL